MAIYHAKKDGSITRVDKPKKFDISEWADKQVELENEWKRVKDEKFKFLEKIGVEDEVVDTLRIVETDD